jgi:hypothetical protein
VAPFTWRHKDVVVSITSIKEWLDAFLALIMLQIIQFLQRQLVICVQVQVLEHPSHFALAGTREVSCNNSFSKVWLCYHFTTSEDKW